MTATAVQEALTGLASADKQQQLQRYFKTGPGQYGEGDVFIGVTVPSFVLWQNSIRLCLSLSSNY